jgi:hypothetical protein
MDKLIILRFVTDIMLIVAGLYLLASTLPLLGVITLVLGYAALVVLTEVEFTTVEDEE